MAGTRALDGRAATAPPRVIKRRGPRAPLIRPHCGDYRWERCTCAYGCTRTCACACGYAIHAYVCACVATAARQPLAAHRVSRRRARATCEARGGRGRWARSACRRLDGSQGAARAEARRASQSVRERPLRPPRPRVALGGRPEATALTAACQGAPVVQVQERRSAQAAAEGAPEAGHAAQASGGGLKPP